MKKWEMTRGVGNSIGYNQNETDKDYASFETLLTDFKNAKNV
jgi:alpha-L-fucosidase